MASDLKTCSFCLRTFYTKTGFEFHLRSKHGASVDAADDGETPQTGTHHENVVGAVDSFDDPIGRISNFDDVNGGTFDEAIGVNVTDVIGDTLDDAIIGNLDDIGDTLDDFVGDGLNDVVIGDVAATAAAWL